MQRFNYPTRANRCTYSIYQKEEASTMPKMREWSYDDGITTIQAATEREAIIETCHILENYLVAVGSSSEKHNKPQYEGALKAVRHIIKKIESLQEI